jgi:hypothetical protein
MEPNAEMPRVDNLNVKGLMDALQSLEVYESRCVYDQYGEVVIEIEHIDAWVEGLTRLLGAPRKPAGENPTEEDLRLTNDYRGIRRNQTLFYKPQNGQGLLAMLWPWSGSYVTLVMAVKKD